MTVAIYTCDNGDVFGCEGFTGMDPWDMCMYFQENLQGYKQFSVEILNGVTGLSLTRSFNTDGKRPARRCREYCEGMAELCREMADAVETIDGDYAENEAFRLHSFADRMQLFMEGAE